MVGVLIEYLRENWSQNHLVKVLEESWTKHNGTGIERELIFYLYGRLSFMA